LKPRFTVIPAVHLFLLRQEEILLLRRYQTGYEDGNYSVPAGHLDGDEEVKSAMIREAYEECGIRIEPEDLNVVGVMHRKSTDKRLDQKVTDERIDFFLATTKWSGTIQNLEPDKCNELAWFHKANLPTNLIPYVKEAIESYQKGTTFTSFGWQKKEE
jgi:8-oxo-dGTP diphosphatase